MPSADDYDHHDDDHHHRDHDDDDDDHDAGHDHDGHSHDDDGQGDHDYRQGDHHDRGIDDDGHDGPVDDNVDDDVDDNDNDAVHDVDCAATRLVEVRALALDKPSVPPGGDVKATGEGCDPDATVTLEIEGEQVGETTADQDGSFSTPIAVPDVDPGRLEVQAHCGPVLTTDLDVVLASSVSGGTSILLVITCSVIVLFALLWYGLRSSRG